MTNGNTVASFEKAFAQRVGARYAIALCNGTATLHTALVALGIEPGQPINVPPLTMSSTSLAVLHAGGTPVYVDVDADSWVMLGTRDNWSIPVSLYGLHYPHYRLEGTRIDDAAQTFRKHDHRAAFTSYSLQASKIVNTGEGGVLVTDDETLAVRAREFSSLGYRMGAAQPRIDPATIKSPTYARHNTLGMNYRMADIVAAEGLKQLKHASSYLKLRAECAAMYDAALLGCNWITPQAGRPNDYWAYAFAVADKDLWQPLVESIVRHGGERPYAAWRLSYHEPVLRKWGGECPNAESLQPRLVQMQTNHLPSAERNAEALARAIAEVG